MSRSRRIAWALVVASAAALVFSLVSLARFIAGYNERNPPSLHYFLPVTLTEFTYAGQPVRFEDQVNEDGSGTVTIAYGDRTLELPIAIPLSEAQQSLPGIRKHADWFRLLVHREGEGFDPGAMEAMRRQGRVSGRLIVAVRRPRAGLDPRSYGEVFRRDWVFEFHAFQPEGGWASQQKRFPESDRSLARRQREARRAGEPVPERANNELVSGTWQFAAAMHVMPEGAAPKHAFTENALVAAGWRWTLAGVSLMVLMFSIAAAMAPSRRDRWSDAERRGGGEAPEHPPAPEA